MAILNKKEPLDIILDINADFQAKIYVKDSAGTAMDLTGYSVASAIKDDLDEVTSVAISSAITDAINGEITLTLTRTTIQTSLTNTNSDYFYDVLLKNGSLITNIVGGKIILKKGAAFSIT